MKKHTSIYLKHFGIGEQDLVYDEYEWIIYGNKVRAVDINHIIPRGMGGSKTKDYIENLMALSRKNHLLFERGGMPHAKEIHMNFLENNPYY